MSHLTQMYQYLTKKNRALACLIFIDDSCMKDVNNIEAWPTANNNHLFEEIYLINHQWHRKGQPIPSGS